MSEDAVAGYAQQALTCVAQPSGTPVAVTAQGRVTLTPGQDVRCTFANAAQPGQVTWSKKAEGTSTDLLAGSVWRIDGPGGQQLAVIDCTASPCTGADQNPAVGAFTVTGLTWGSYTLNETVAPPGYVRSLTPIPFTVGAGQTPGAGASVALGTLLHKKTPPVLLPLTGGMGTDAYLVAGGACWLWRSASRWSPSVRRASLTIHSDRGGVDHRHPQGGGDVAAGLTRRWADQ